MIFLLTTGALCLNSYILDFVPATATTFKVSMSPWTNYTFRVIARNKVGDSLPSGHSKVCLTPEDVPYKNPDNVMGRGHAPNNLVISWTVSQTSLFSVAKATLELALSVDQS